MVESKRYLTVTAINRYLAAKFDSDINLKNMPIMGEVSNVRISKGHLYFVLKDEESEISAIMFQNNVAALDFKVTDGVKVIVKANLELYQKRGTYALIVSAMKEYGLGLLYQEFLRLKEKLSKEGLFDEKYKKEIPSYALNIGLITSSTGDAMHDVISTISKRFPLATVYLYPALVQGSDAPNSLINAINRLNSDNLVDVAIIARGGGSFEDLSCFNDEALARTIFNSKIPIVSGVGHEADYTICDFVSDFRAPTPTGAAVRVTVDKENLFKDLDLKQIRLTQAVKRLIENKQNTLEKLVKSHYFYNFNEYLDKIELRLASEIDRLNNFSPIKRIENYEKNLEYLNKRLISYNLISKLDDKLNEVNNDINKMNNSFNNLINNQEMFLDNLLGKMIVLNPMNLMKKGYSLVYKNDLLLTGIDNVNIDDEIDIKMSNGKLTAKVLNKE